MIGLVIKIQTVNGGECNTYNNTPIIIYGDGIDFIDNNYVRLPQTSIYKQGM